MNNEHEFFETNFNKLLNQKPLRWRDLKMAPKYKGCYIICHIDKPNFIYVGESKNMWDRLYKHHRTGNHSSFRRNLESRKVKNHFQPKDVVIEQFLDECVVYCLPMIYGRKELEEWIIAKYNPPYNIEK